MVASVSSYRNTVASMLKGQQGFDSSDKIIAGMSTKQSEVLHAHRHAEVLPPQLLVCGYSLLV